MCKIWRYVAMVCFFLFIFAGLMTGRYYILYNQSQEAVKYERDYSLTLQKEAVLYSDLYKSSVENVLHWQGKCNDILDTLQESAQLTEKLRQGLGMAAQNYAHVVDYIKTHFNIDYDPQWEQ